MISSPSGRLVGDLEAALEQEHHVVAGVALLPQDGARVERHLAAERAEVGERPRQALHEDARPLVLRLSGHVGPMITPEPGLRGRAGVEVDDRSRSPGGRRGRTPCGG